MEATTVKRGNGAAAKLKKPTAVKPQPLKLIPVKYWAFAGA